MSIFTIFFFVFLSFFFDHSNVLVALIVLSCTFVIWGSNTFGGVFFIDDLSFILIFLTLLIFTYCFFSSFLDFWSSNFFNGFVTTLGMMFLLILMSFSCLSFLLFYFSFEFLFLLMFFFLLNWGYSPERLQAAFYMIFYTLVVSLPFLIYVIMMSKTNNSIFGLFWKTEFYWWPFFLLVFLVKLPVYMTHLWLPKAHVEAPVSGSMILAGVLLKLGGYGLMRFMTSFLEKTMSFNGYLISLGILGGLFSCFLCLRQSDLKAFVAYSSICHMGFGLSGLSSGSFLGYKGSILMLVSHGYCSSCLFYILFIFYERFYSRSMLILKGLSTVLPIMSMMWFVFSIINMGVPPFFPFFSEIMLISSLMSKSLTSFIFSGLMLFLAGSYCIYLYVLCFHGKSASESKLNLINLREFLNIFSHFSYLIISPFFIFFLL